MEVKLVVPWNIDGFTGDESQKSFILRKLSDRKFDIKQFSREPEDASIMRLVEVLMVELSQNDWILLVSNSPTVVKTATDLMPIVFALSNRKSVVGVSNNLLERLYQGNSDDEFTNPMDFIAEINKTCLVVHKNINEANSRLKQFKGQTAEFMDCRGRTGKKYLMTALNRSGKVDNSIFSELEDIFGKTVASWIENKSERLVFNSESKPKSWRRIKVE